MSAEVKTTDEQPDLELAIAHLLLIDIVGYSKLLVNEQIEAMQQLNALVRQTNCFRAAESAEKLMRIPTGDGMALLFFRSPEEPVRCALEISVALQETAAFRVRMGVHSGPVNVVMDVNDRANVAGSGINVAQRVMDCADAGHILLSKHVADDLAQYRHWGPYLTDLGECEVKHGLHLQVYNLCKDGAGNPARPLRFEQRKKWGHKNIATAGAGKFSRSRLILVPALLIGLLAISTTSIFLLRRARPATSVTPGHALAAVKSIAVLPFQNLSDERQNEYFTTGIQEEILNDLAKVADLRVISRTSVMPYRNADARNLRDIAAVLGVSYIVEGSVQRVGSRVRVTAQLVDAKTDTHIWAERYDRDLADVFALESELAEKIVSKLTATLSPEEKAAIEEPPTRDLAAYELYLRAKKLLDAKFIAATGKEDLLEAVRLLEQAVTRDPAFLQAHYYRSSVHDIIYFLGIDHTAARRDLAEQAVQAMKRLRPDAGETHLAIAQHFYRGYRDYDRAREELALARRTLPNEPLTFLLDAHIDRRQGRWQASAQKLERALELDPQNVFILQVASLNYQYLRRFNDMARTAERIIKINPDDSAAHVQRAWVDFLARGDPQQLHSTIDSVIRHNPDAATAISAYWFYLSLCERDQPALKRALGAMPSDGCRDDAIPFPRSWCEGLVARAAGNHKAAQAAFIRARAEAEEVLRQQPDYAEEICVLGMIEGALGNKDEAIRAGHRAVELLPLSKDAYYGAKLQQYLAIIYAWTGEKNLAMDELAKLAVIPSEVNFGDLRLNPCWDPLRRDPRFEKILTSLASQH